MKKRKLITNRLLLAFTALLVTGLTMLPQAEAFSKAVAAMQQQSVTGKVTDPTGKALSGVSILIKGTSTGTLTDANGNFSINAGNNDVLTVSFVGFTTQQVSVNGQTSLNITLQVEKNVLNEVVVIGFGTQSKRLLTGAISSVKSSDLENQQVVRFDDALQGRTTGVTVVQSSGAPGAGPTMRVRGVTSINNSDPLYVIDGVVVDNGGLDNINPGDIESIDVLKDASAAIYGSRASNGVIIVTTKKGKVGAPQLSYNGYYGIQGPVKKLKLADAEQYATLRNESLANDGAAPLFANPSAFGKGTNWQNEIFTKNAPIQNHDISISGGNENGRYYTSFGYLNQQGLVLSDISNYKRFNYALNSSYKLRKWVTIGENINYAYTKSQGSLNTNSEFGGPLSSAINLDPITQVVVTDMSTVDPSFYTNPNIIRNSKGQPYGISQYVGQEMSNPLAYEQTQLGNYNWAHNLIGNAYIEVTPIRGLTLRSTLAAKKAFYGNQSFTPLYYLNSVSGNLTNTSAYRESDQNFTWNWDNTASYDFSTGLNNVTVLVGTSAQKESGNGVNANYIGLPVSNYTQSSFNFSVAQANRIAGAYDNQPYSLSSVFGRVIYNYDEKYLFSGVIRRDGSSKFGSDNVYGVFPSAEAGWIISKEKFMATSQDISFLKLRASYGVLGNEMSLSTFQYAATISGGRNYVLGNDVLNIGYSPNAPSNPNLKWEQTATADIGLDATIYKNINVTIDVYNKKTKGMLQTVQQPFYAGYNGQPWENVGDLVNKGAELSLGYTKSAGEFRFNATGNISYNHNEVTYLGTQPYYETGTFQNSTYALGRTQVGHPVGEFYGFQEIGIFKSQDQINSYVGKNNQMIQPNAKPGDFIWKDINGDGVINDKDRTFLGSNLPTWIYGFTISASYKKFDFLAFGQGVSGNKVFQAYRRLDVTNANYPIEALDAWTPDNPNGKYPRLTDKDPNNNIHNPSNFYLQNGAYFRLKTLQIGYTLPKSVVEKATFKNVRVYISANNLFTLTKYNGFDPEVSGSIDKGVYPSARTYMFGLNVSL